jgi:hypothetical protein
MLNLEKIVAPQCPFCRMKMLEDVVRKNGKKIWIWVCHRDKIAVAQTDPCVGKWDDPKREIVPCPNCNANMLTFFTSTGYFLAKCPKTKCRCSVTMTDVKDPVETKQVGKA